MTRSDSYSHSPRMGFLGEFESIEIPGDQRNRLSLPNQNHLPESDSSHLLLPPEEITPSESKSSSACK